MAASRSGAPCPPHARAKTRLEFGPDGVRCRINAPASRREKGQQPVDTAALARKLAHGIETLIGQSPYPCTHLGR